MPIHVDLNLLDCTDHKQYLVEYFIANYQLIDFKKHLLHIVQSLL